MPVLLAVVMVATLGTWIPLAQLVPGTPERTRVFYVAVGNVIFTAAALLISRTAVTFGWRAFWLPLAGGAVWAAGNYCVLQASRAIGLARAAGTWTPLNIVAAFVWGAVLFGELDGFSAARFAVLGIAFAAVVAGVLLIALSRSDPPETARDTAAPGHSSDSSASPPGPPPGPTQAGALTAETAQADALAAETTKASAPPAKSTQNDTLAAEPTQADTRPTEPAQARTRPAETIQADTRPVEPAQVGTARAETTRAAAAGAETTRAATAGIGLTRAATARAETTRAATARAETTRAATARAETTRAATAGAETTRARTTRAGTARAGTARAGTAGAGLLWAGAAGILWGSYFVPAQWAGVPAQVSDFPLALGILAGAFVLALPAGEPVKLGGRAVSAQLGAGVLFGIGNLALLALVARVGTGTGFTIAQLSLAVNAGVGIWVFHVPPPGTRQAWKVLAGIVIAGIGGCVIAALR